MSLREDRLNGFIRTIMHWPTTAMLADGLLKGGCDRTALIEVTQYGICQTQDDYKRPP